MDGDKKEIKSPFSGGFIWFVLAAIFLAMMVQNLVDIKMAPVSFSYQLESLVNLDLIHPEESRKTAATGNLVTFSGRFRDRLTDEGKSRYKYLELLDRIRWASIGAYENQDIPFDELVNTIQPPRDLSRNPLVQVMFALQNAHASSAVRSSSIG